MKLVIERCVIVSRKFGCAMKNRGRIRIDKGLIFSGLRRIKVEPRPSSRARSWFVCTVFLYERGSQEVTPPPCYATPGYRNLWGEIERLKIFIGPGFSPPTKGCARLLETPFRTYLHTSNVDDLSKPWATFSCLLVDL